MSNTSIERMLELNTRIEKGITESKPKMNGGKSVASQRDLDRLIEDFDRQVYGQTPIMQNEQKTEKYSAQKEMERLKEIDEAKFDRILVAYENEEHNMLKNELNKLKKKGKEYNIAIVIGPEGGISEKEIDILKEKNAVFVSLGKRILRTETAGF